MRLPGQQDWKIAWLLFAVAFLAYATFLQEPRNANTASRMFLGYALTTNGTLSIDSYAQKTEDRAEYLGHFFSDKAPGQTFLALPAIMLARSPSTRWEAAHPREVRQPDEKEWPPGYMLTTYAATLSTSAILTALSVAALYLFAQSLFASSAPALLVALTYAFATPAFGWATAFIGHAPAMALSVIGLALLHFAAGTASVTKQTYVLSGAAAACLTAGVVTEFTAAPAACLIALYALTHSPLPLRTRLIVAAASVVPVIIVATPLLLYNAIAFGSPMRLGYSALQDFPGMNEGFFGLTAPSLSVLREITVGARRGILWICPLLIFVPVGLWRMIREPALRSTGILVLLIVSYYFLLNASYHYWDGGGSTGPRHVTAMLPFACLAVGTAWLRGERIVRSLILSIILASALMSFLCTVAGMYATPNEPRLISGVLIPTVLHGSTSATPVWLFGLMRSRHFVALWAIVMTATLILFYKLRRVDDSDMIAKPALQIRR